METILLLLTILCRLALIARLANATPADEAAAPAQSVVAPKPAFPRTRRRVICGGLGFALALLSGQAAPTVSRWSPARQVVAAGAPLNVSVTATGTGTVTYQWLRNGLPLAGANQSVFTLPASGLRDGGCYQAQVSDATGSRRSEPMFVLITSPRSDIVVWGSIYRGLDQVPAGLTDVVAVAMGEGHALALRADGTVVAWGNNANGQAAVPANLGNVVAIAVGSAHSLALRADGGVVAWGYNGNGEISVPPGLRDAIAIAAGSDSSVAIRTDGTAVGWGGADYSKLPRPLHRAYAGIEKLTNVASVSVGLLHSIVLLKSGTVVALPEPDASPESRIPFGLSRVVSIAAGWDHSMALREDGTVVVWGNNDDGQLNLPAGLEAVGAISAGPLNSLALQRDGTVVAWGYNKDGQSNVPAGLQGVYAVDGGFSATIALRTVGDDFTPVTPTPPAPPASMIGPSITVTKGSGGGGAPSDVFVAALGLLSLLRLRQQRACGAHWENQ
jgi:hypothetical protein